MTNYKINERKTRKNGTPKDTCLSLGMNMEYRARVVYLTRYKIANKEWNQKNFNFMKAEKPLTKIQN
ncbi:hypothetical protein Avbf_13513 [Armadillidium vulgare]|nr:hypothetical protein Avbf_13513 [Armadillidium vulgare]